MNKYILPKNAFASPSFKIHGNSVNYKKKIYIYISIDKKRYPLKLMQYFFNLCPKIVRLQNVSILPICFLFLPSLFLNSRSDLENNGQKDATEPILSSVGN